MNVQTCLRSHQGKGVNLTESNTQRRPGSHLDGPLRSIKLVCLITTVRLVTEALPCPLDPQGLEGQQQTPRDAIIIIEILHRLSSNKTIKL